LIIYRDIRVKVHCGVGLIIALYMTTVKRQVRSCSLCRQHHT